MSDVSPADLTARLRALFLTPDGDPDYDSEADPEWATIREAADRIDLLTTEAEERSEWNHRITDDLGRASVRIDDLSADVARLTARSDEFLALGQQYERERDEALARVAEQAATIERLRAHIVHIGHPDWCVGGDYRPRDCTCGYEVALADTAPTPETHT